MSARLVSWLILPCLGLACGDSDGSADDAATTDDAGAEDAREDAGDVPGEEASPGDDAAVDVPTDLPADLPSDLPADLPADVPADADDGGADSCVRTTCELAGAECGPLDDGCGGTLDCGGCPGPLRCGHAAPNRCGCTPGAWTVETVYADGQAGLFSGLAVDAARGLHVSFSSVGSGLGAGGVVYGRRDARGEWMFSRVEDGLCGFGCTGVRNAIAVDGAGLVHVLYHDELFENPEYGQSADGTTWRTGYVCPTCGAAGYHPALAVDGAGRLHAFHVDSAGSGTPHYATLPPGGGLGDWTDQRLDTRGGGYGGSIATDALGGVHAAWDDPGDDDVRYAYREPTGGTWSYESIVDPGDTGHDTAIAVEPSGIVHVLHYDLPAVNVRHSLRATDGNWTTTTVDATRGSGQGNVLARGADGRLHAAYFHNRSSGADLVYAVRGTDGSWTTETVPGTGAVWGGLALGVDDRHTVYISCYEQDRQDLQLVSRCPGP